MRELGIEVVGYVERVGSVDLTPNATTLELSPSKQRELRNASDLFSLQADADEAGKSAIDVAKASGDTLGGVVVTRVYNAPFGLGTHAQWSRKLDGKLAQAVAAIQAFKGVEIGSGFELASTPGSASHDEILWDESQRVSRSLGFVRPTNRAGGLEGGMTNSKPIVVRAAMKPIPTLRKPLRSIDLDTKESVEASFERSDACAISAASVVMENVVAFEIAAAVVEKFGGDSLDEIKARIALFEENAARRLGAIEY